MHIAPLYLSSSRAVRKAMAQSFAQDAADGLRTEADAAADLAARMIASLRNAGAGSISIGAVKDALADAFKDCQGAIIRALDSEGLEPRPEDTIDLSEVEAS